jgi:hypothetical protein
VSGFVKRTKRWWIERRHKCIMPVTNLSILCTVYVPLCEDERVNACDCTLPLMNRQAARVIMRRAYRPIRADGCHKLSRRLARCYLVIALFPSPRASRSVTVSVSLRSPAANLVTSQQQVTFSTTVALRITRTAWRLRSDHLCPFALGMALPSALVGRYFHDYYGHSVSLEVALFRKSRVPSR